MNFAQGHPRAKNVSSEYLHIQGASCTLNIWKYSLGGAKNDSVCRPSCTRFYNSFFCVLYICESLRWLLQIWKLSNRIPKVPYSRSICFTHSLNGPGPLPSNWQAASFHCLVPVVSKMNTTHCGDVSLSSGGVYVSGQLTLIANQNLEILIFFYIFPNSHANPIACNFQAEVNTTSQFIVHASRFLAV